ncbi:DUF922 domain-containing protein [Peteryoungia desertarenae]|uniref:DUF922 domain-containing protein n=2 Tax=Peteryoungia desertarenae TaxID=1813451 RepID=A0ABX6QQE3_9HYPH|nr:DUF922 domain-containing protein [Peteryoungia desertarenae]
MTTYRRLPALGLGMAMIAIGIPAAEAEMLATKSITYFNIGGRTAEEIDNELTRKGPLTNSTGLRHPGATRIQFGGDLSYVEDGRRCWVEDVQVTVNTRIILPRWTNRKRADTDMALLWDTLASDIKRHEERHAEIARQYARELQDALTRLRPERDCTRMQDKVAETTDRVTDEHDKAQIQFDRVEAKNFEARMIRLLRYRSGRSTN